MSTLTHDDLVKFFVTDLQIEGCNVIAGDINTAEIILTPDNVLEFLAKSGKKNRYIVSGCSLEAGIKRVLDTDIVKKRHIFFDFDLKYQHPEITEEGIKEAAKRFKQVLAGTPYASWRYLVYTGSGLHLHFFSPEPITPTNNRLFAAGYKVMMREIEALVGEKADSACSNLARLVRLPGSWNSKPQTLDRWGEPKAVRILGGSPGRCLDFKEIEEWGAVELERQKEVAKKKAAERMDKFVSSEHSTFEAINSIPISSLVASKFGWETDGRNFWADNRKHKACYVPDGENFLVHGGTHWITSDAEGFSCFTFIKTVEGYDNKQTFEWFKENFPSINDISKEEFKERLQDKKVVEIVEASPITETFKELESLKFDILQTGKSWCDDNKLFIRGAVTRIGAFSNTGKSSLAYWVSYWLLANGYTGAIFSSEVTAPVVLANLLKARHRWDYWDIVNHKEKPTPEDYKFFEKLRIYDGRHTKNKLATIRDILEKLKVDFVVIDFLQGISPIERGESNYEKVTNYAFEVQQMAQELDISVIDLSQIPNADNGNLKSKDSFIKRAANINFKGSGDLFSSCDIALTLDRKRRVGAEEDEEVDENAMFVAIRKHKYTAGGSFELRCDLKYGRFDLTDEALYFNPF